SISLVDSDCSLNILTERKRQVCVRHVQSKRQKAAGGGNDGSDRTEHPANRCRRGHVPSGFQHRTCVISTMTPAGALGITVPYRLVLAAGELDMINLTDERGWVLPYHAPKFARTSFALPARSRFRPITVHCGRSATISEVQWPSNQVVVPPAYGGPVRGFAGG